MVSDVGSLARPLRGIIPPMVTPLADRDALDVAGLERLVEHILAGGVHGLFILGTMGEAPSLSHRLRHELVDRVCARVNRRVPVLVGIIDTSFVEALGLARKAADAGADGLVLPAPHYYPAGQPELLEFLRHLVPQLPLPAFLYNLPNYPRPMFDPETVQIAAAEMPGIVGLKDSSANMTYFRHLQFLMADRPDFALLMGPEMLLAETVLLGGHGGICGGANLLPRLYVDLYEAACAGDMARVQTLHRKVTELARTIYRVGRFESSFLKGLKCALSCLGICSDFLAEPLHRFRGPERDIVQRHITDLGITTNGFA